MEPQLNTINPSTLILIEVRNIMSIKLNQLLTCKSCIQKMRTLAVYFKTQLRQILSIEPVALVACRGPDFVEVDSHHLVGVSERDVEIKFVLENVVVGCEIELGEFGIRYLELEATGINDEKRNDVGKENDENHGDCGFQKAL